MPSSSSQFILFSLALAGIAALTRPTKASLRRNASRAARDGAGGGVVGWAAGKVAAAAFQLALDQGGYKVSNLIVALLVQPTAELNGTEARNWIFIGMFSNWLQFNTKTGDLLLMHTSPEE